MATKLPRRPTPLLSTSPLSPLNLKPSHTPLSHTPSRAATIIRRPRRPYTFTQLVQLSDGSTFTMRTTSPLALYKSTRDTRNHVLWQPNEKSLHNLEVDEAGRLAAFRGRYGRSWDAEGTVEEEGKGGDGGSGGGGDPLSDLIRGYTTREKDEASGGGKKKKEGDE
ncbi:hypothetical protein F5B20DRAFT_92015 [Whalleya microplaca]|nr:hypothetical protein F5B20DRAFT_92015 [Whalleya microplaca]